MRNIGAEFLTVLPAYSSQEPLQRITLAPPYARPLARLLLPDDSIVVDAGEYVPWSDAMYCPA